jgi:quercetin dioxygenase-like cupin family protein
MAVNAGYEVVRVADIPWEDRRNVDNWPSRAGMYYDDRENNLCMRLIDYPLGSIEPRHVHGGSHATTVLKGRAIVDGLTLQPLDVILGPSNEPHGPLDYPDGCKLLSVFHGSYHHSEVQKLSGENLYRLIQSGQIPWKAGEAKGAEEKTLVDRGVGRLVLKLLRFPRGGTLAGNAYPTLRAALLVEGSAKVGDETLSTWDFLRVPGGARGKVEFPTGATLLAVTLAQVTR